MVSTLDEERMRELVRFMAWTLDTGRLAADKAVVFSREQQPFEAQGKQERGYIRAKGKCQPLSCHFRLRAVETQKEIFKVI